MRCCRVSTTGVSNLGFRDAARSLVCWIGPTGLVIGTSRLYQQGFEANGLGH